MNLMEQWRSVAYNEATGKDKLQQLWAAYFQEEKEIYAQLLKNPDEVVKGTVKELADKYQVSLMTMTGFLDGINDSLVEKNPLDDLEEDTEVNLGFDKALLYKNMVAAEADCCTIWKSGTLFSMKRPARNSTKSRNLPLLL